MFVKKSIRQKCRCIQSFIQTGILLLLIWRGINQIKDKLIQQGAIFYKNECKMFVIQIFKKV